MGPESHTAAGPGGGLAVPEVARRNDAGREAARASIWRYAGPAMSADSHGAPPSRSLAAPAGPGDLGTAARAQVLDAVMKLYGGALVVLDASRRIVASNTAYFDLLGLDHAPLGRSIGEAAGCTFAREHGCGAGQACSACGAFLAIGEGLRRRERVERDCALRVERGGVAYDLALHVNAVPLEGDPPLLLLTLTDTSPERRRAAVQGVLLDEFTNLVTALSTTTAELASRAPPQLRDVVADLASVAQRLEGELKVQQVLVAARGHVSAPAGHVVDLDMLVAALSKAMSRHPSAVGKLLETRVEAGHGVLAADHQLLQRVLIHMVVNAFEATDAGEEVRLTVGGDAAGVEFRVWNAAVIPPEVVPRIFQRYFSTKPGTARGQGTYLMKLLGERVLGGEVGFASAAGQGTTFWLRVPMAGPTASAAGPCDPPPALTPVPGLRRVIASPPPGRPGGAKA
jgi:signal transduction histidine kinase